MENASPEMLELMGQQIPAVSELRELHKHYQDGLNAIVDHPDATSDQREEAYGELYETTSQKFEEISKRVASEVSETRRKLNESAFGVPGLGTASGPNAGSTVGYRDAIFRLTNASSSELTQAADIAERTGDMELLKAVGVVADMRGDRALAHRYFDRAPAAYDDYVRRNSLPTDSTLGALTKAYSPRAIQPNQLTPSPIAQQRKKDAERAKNARKARIFGR
jgi:hypothetical protein